MPNHITMSAISSPSVFPSGRHNTQFVTLSVSYIDSPVGGDKWLSIWKSHWIIHSTRFFQKHWSVDEITAMLLLRTTSMLLTQSHTYLIQLMCTATLHVTSRFCLQFEQNWDKGSFYDFWHTCDAPIYNQHVCFMRRQQVWSCSV